MKRQKDLNYVECEGYVVKVCERDGGGEESIDYVLGPRGKAEIGERGVAGWCGRRMGRKTRRRLSWKRNWCEVWASW